MAKTQIKNYVFKPGLGTLSNRFPDAYSLLESNKTFIQKEANAYITSRISNAAQYTPTNATYTPTTGVLVLTIGSHTFNVGDAITIAEEGLVFTCELDGNATTHAYPRASGVPNDTGTDPYYNKAIQILNTTSTTITVNIGISSDTSVHTFVSATANSVSDTFYNYTNTSQAKCERDVGYVIDAYLEDLRYGGNQSIRNVIKYYWDQTVAQVDGDRGPEIAAHNFIQRLITDYIFTNSAFSALNTEVSQTIDATKTVTALSYTPSGANYNPSTGEMVLTIGAHSISTGDEIQIAPAGLTFTCGLDGNATLHPYPRRSGVPNEYGKDKFYYAPVAVTSTTSTTITVNVGVSSDTSTHTFVSATTNAITAGAPAKIKTLAFNTVDVISNGLTAQPVLVPIGLGYVKIQGRYNADELLLISNATRSEVMYNFTNVATGAKVLINDSTTDSDFGTYLQTTDAVTTIELNYDTSTHSADDEIQIFVERIENGKSVVTTRPYDFGTDAIERNRVANPLSMLDADFEYGLQPTKWAAIGTLRGYPSIYELPGTDTPVVTVTTDASSGTGGVGQSLITVTTNGAHGFGVGTPITIKALEDSVVGAARAEGSFVIVNIVSPTQFQYFAKSKVGTTNGDVLSTTYTQLRQAGFYTGASIGNPDIQVVSNGSAGSMVTQLAVLQGSTIIPFDDQAPSIGAPLVAANGAIPLGSQVTGVVDQSAGGGLYLTALTEGDVQAGTSQVDVQNVTGIVEDLAFDRGDGYAIYVQSIAGNTITFNSPFTEPVIGNRTQYTNLTGNNGDSIGENARFDISFASDSSFTYVLDAIANDGGEGYEIGDRIIIPGTSLGGTSPEHDALIIVTDVLDSANSIASADIFGTHINTDQYITGLTATYSGGTGEGASFNISFENNNFTSTTVAIAGTGYVVGDLLKVDGSILSDLASPVQALYISVDAVDVNGGITSISTAGTAPNSFREYFGVTYTTTSVSGASAIINITSSGTTYSAEFVNAGVNYLATENFTIAGTDLGGLSPTHDCTIVIDNVDGNGSITNFTVSGTPFNGETVEQAAIHIIGTGATFNVSQNAAVYVGDLQTPGSGYNVGQELVIAGTVFGGESPANDVTITVTSIDSLVTGNITGISTSGTGYEPIGIYIDVLGVNDPNTGSNAEFSILRDNAQYSNLLITNNGTGYEIGNRIVIPGSQLGGITPLNDLIIRVQNVNPSGGITSTQLSYEEAAYGNYFDLISTITMSEASTAAMPAATAITYGALATLQVQFPNAHGLVPGNTFITSITSDDGVNNHNLAAGSHIVTNIPAIDTLEFQARAEGTIDTGTLNSLPIEGSVYPRPDSFFIHRPYDGGVQLGTGGPQHGAQAIRQSKKYIRYQSGKGIMYTTGALFAPSYDLRSLTAEDVEVGSLITVVTDDNDHGVQQGGIIRILGVETPGYNSGNETAVPPRFDYEVAEIVDERTFKIRAQRRLGSTNAVLGFGAQMSVVSWHGATVRSGIFDDQNGIFWEYDGTNVSVNQRTGTRQLAGTIAMQVDDNLVTGTNTRFRDQLNAGDRIIIKGMTHVVTHVNSQTELTVTPDWRGVVNITGTKANLVVDKKVKQRDFNLDRLDGTGPSGYDIDIAKMQMIGIQYSWYGAGFIDFMLRGSDGNFVFCHRMRNSNVNTEAFMRSGNLPVRYEVTNEGPNGKLAADMSSDQNFIPLVDSSFFPESGTVYIDNEIIDFTGKDDTSNRLTGCIRGATFENFQAGATRQYVAGAAATHLARTGVILISQTITPLISHWGSAFLTDGGFDEDRGYIFSYAETGIEVSTTKQTAFLIRLSPSVSNALVGDLGERELLNRAQLLLQSLEVTSDYTALGGIVVEGVLNPNNYPENPADVNWSGLSGLAQGGQPSFAQIASGGGINWGTANVVTDSNSVVAGAISGTFNLQQRIGNNNQDTLEDGNDRFYITTNDVLNNDINVGDTITGVSTGSFPGGTTIQSISYYNEYGLSSYGNFEYFARITVSNDYNGPGGNDVSGTQTVTMTRARTGSTYGKTNNLPYTQTSWQAAEAAGVGLNTEVDSSDTSWPAGTRISQINEITYGGTTFYEVFYNATSTQSISSGSNTVFNLSTAQYAEPGETVFSFIAAPGERATVDFSELKELTNTPLGGRGTYPNGPDVLAINVYKVSGSPIDANLILRWGEAQA